MQFVSYVSSNRLGRVEDDPSQKRFAVTSALMIIDSRVSTTGMNGDATSPMLRSPSSMSASRPTVDSLLEELNTAVPNGWAFCVCVCVLINSKTM